VTEQRRKLLFEQLGALKPAMALTESIVVGISRVGAGKVSDGEEYERLLAALKLKKKNKNNPCDALIAETVLKNKLTLISADNALCAVMREAGGSVVQFKKTAQPRKT
jgi:hypothetical protein